MVIPPRRTYETSVRGTSHGRANSYATAGANPNALANGLRTDLFASIQ